jgi:Sigma54-dependent transcription regulator containing an AAA-type ATPase domain and a DNA-binding domain
MKRRVVISILGNKLDLGKPARRWDKWRPNVGMCQQPEFPIDRVELIYGPRDSRLRDVIANDIASVSPATKVQTHLLELKDPWDLEEVYGALHDFAQDYQFDLDNEEYLINITTGTHVVQICWFLLAEARIVPAQLLQLSPPKEPMPEEGYAGTYRVVDLDLSRYDEIARRFAASRMEATSFLKNGIATRNPAFNRMIDEIEKVVLRSTAPVLLTGPTGAGKSQLAKRIFDLKRTQHQMKGKFVEVNCATLRGDHAMSTLFGHVKGAFTGAASDRPGLLKAADGGILFLDEIGELGLDEQAMCLRAIEEKRFLPVGSDREVSADFQLIAGTNRDLAEEVRKGRFREDLYARLNLWTFKLPSLRDRKEDIEPNLEYELGRHLLDSGQKVTFNREARDRYLTFATSLDSAWSANFRDLSASVTRMATLASEGRIDTEVVDAEIERLKSAWGVTKTTTAGHGSLLVEALGEERAALIDRFDVAQLEEVIRVCRASPSASAAGRELFAVSRLSKSSSNDADRLKKYLARFGLRFEDLSR